MIAFFDLLPVKPASLTLFFEENMSEKGWVVSLQVNESEFRIKYRVKMTCAHSSKMSFAGYAVGIRDYGQCPIHILVFMAIRGILDSTKYQIPY